MVPAFPRCQRIRSRPQPPSGSERLVTTQKWRTRLPSRSRSPWRANADRKIAARRDRVLLPDAVAGQVINLGPFADSIDLRLVGFPLILRQGGDAFCQLRAHIGRNGIADRL